MLKWLVICKLTLVLNELMKKTRLPRVCVADHKELEQKVCERIESETYTAAGRCVCECVIGEWSVHIG